MDHKELARVCEAILFAAGEPVETERLCFVTETDPEELRAVMKELMDLYAFERRGIRILRLEDSWQMCSQNDLAPWVTKALETRKPPKLSASQLETLTIIAYYQPTTKAFVEKLRGVDSSYSVSALLNNAGVISRGYSLTADGFENTFCINYFAPFLLTQLLLDRIPSGGCVVNMVSLTCRFVRVKEASLRPTQGEFSQLGTYARSKLALLHFSQELGRRRPDLRVNLADPGIVNSGIISMGRWFDPLADVVFRPFIKSPQKGAIPPLAALASDRTARYFVGNGSRDIPDCYRDPELERRLWEETERLL